MDTTRPHTADDAAVREETLSWVITIAHHPVRSLMGKRLVVAEHALFGRGSRCFGVDGVFEDERVSREHAEVRQDAAGTLTIRDLDSRNGTFVNGARVTHSELAAGDVVGVGKLLFIVTRAPAVYPLPSDEHLVGVSAAFSRACGAVDQVAAHATPVLFEGPPGSGKTALAERLHRKSGRGGPLVRVCCGAVDEGLLHSELFGHTRGAFAGADQARAGLIESAEGGTLLLDAVASAPERLQLSLLGFLETGEVRKLGADSPVRVDVRVVATASESLDSLVASGRLRRDFADRIGRWRIPVPPLADHVEDIALLADLFLMRYAGPDARLGSKLVLQLLRREWPGHARELEAVVEHAVIAGGGGDLIELPAHDSAPAPVAVAVARNGEWFRLPDGERVSIADRSTLVGILRELIARRQSAPGAAMTVSELLAAGWPGERVSGPSGANRVYVALTMLRRLGLRALIDRTKQGYLIPADAPINLV